MKARELLESGENWTDLRTRQILPSLLGCAVQGRTITYSELDAEIVKGYGVKPTMPIAYRFVLEKVGRLIAGLSEEWLEKIPPLNILVVNKDSREPGQGFDVFLQQYASGTDWAALTTQNHAAVISWATDAVFGYRRWFDMAKYFGVSISTSDSRDQSLQLPLPSPIRGGESDAHRRLKEYIAEHPSVISQFGEFGPGETEVMLLSGDKVDVVFRTEDHTLVVEVKTADVPPGELTRGIFQCVKYRAVLRAMHQIEKRMSDVQVVLATPQRLGDVHQQAARLLEVSILKLEG